MPNLYSLKIKKKRFICEECRYETQGIEGLALITKKCPRCGGFLVEQINIPIEYKIGIVVMLVGIILTITIVGAVIGIPLVIVGFIISKKSYKKIVYIKVKIKGKKK